MSDIEVKVVAKDVGRVSESAEVLDMVGIDNMEVLTGNGERVSNSRNTLGTRPDDTGADVVEASEGGAGGIRGYIKFDDSRGEYIELGESRTPRRSGKLIDSSGEHAVLRSEEEIEEMDVELEWFASEYAEERLLDCSESEQDESHAAMAGGAGGVRGSIHRGDRNVEYIEEGDIADVVPVCTAGKEKRRCLCWYVGDNSGEERSTGDGVSGSKKDSEGTAGMP